MKIDLGVEGLAPVESPFEIVQEDGESASLFNVTDPRAPTDDQPCVLDTFSSRAESEKFIRAKAIKAALYDALRKSDSRQTANVLTRVMTPGVLALGQKVVIEAIQAVYAFSEFTYGNDPHGEHDFGKFKVGDHVMIWKIDDFGEPPEGAPTQFVLTLMLEEEY